MLTVVMKVGEIPLLMNPKTFPLVLNKTTFFSECDSTLLAEFGIVLLHYKLGCKSTHSNLTNNLMIDI